MNQPQDILKNLSGIALELKQVSNFSPCPQVDNLLSQLVHIADKTTTTVANQVLSDANISELVPFFQSVSAQSEAELEKYWSSRIARAVEPLMALQTFIYFSNYEQMTDDEINILKQNNLDSNKRVLFIGGGALPLSAILMAKKHGYRVNCIDNDAESCRLAQQLVNSLGLSGLIRIFESDIRDLHTFTDYDVMILAALVGDNKDEKMLIINHIKDSSKSDIYILLRSVEALGVLLYQPVTDNQLFGMQVLHRGVKNSNYINTAILGKFSYG